MNKKEMMHFFIDRLNSDNLITLFIKNIFDYQNIYDYNYLFRLVSCDDSVIIDIYDNVSENRFNRYIYSFGEGDYDINVIEECNVFVSSICVNNVVDSDNKLLKLAYLFKLDNDKMIEYAKTFLDRKIVSVLEEVKSKSIYE